MKTHIKTPTIFLVAFIFTLLLSCGKKLTVCECMHPPDKNHEERCRNWFTYASHEEYVEMMKEKEKCN